MPKDKSPQSYKDFQHTSKESLKNLVLDTQKVIDADVQDRADKLKTNWTAKSLFQSTIKFKAWRKKYSKSGKIMNRKPTPYRGTGSVIFTQLQKGVTQFPDDHRVTIMFSGLKFAAEPFKGCIDVEYKGHMYYVEKPSLSKTTIRVRCSCKDFYFCFSLWDYLERAIVGPKPKQYKRKTPPPEQGGRPYRNPKHIPGLCKHIFNALQFLKAKGWVKP